MLMDVTSSSGAKLTRHREVLQLNSPPMSSTLFRLGLWIILAVVALYVLHETYAETHLAEYFSTPMLQKALIVGGLIVIAGLVTRVIEQGAKKVVHRHRCSICKVP